MTLDLKNKLNKEVERWLVDLPIVVHSNLTLNAKITIKDDGGNPDSKGVFLVEKFIVNPDELWSIVFNNFLVSNRYLPVGDVLKSIDKNIYLFAPALVGSTVYELLVLIDLKLESNHRKSYRFCFNENQLVSLVVDE